MKATVHSCVICLVTLGHFSHLVENLLIIVSPGLEVVFEGALTRSVNFNLMRKVTCYLKLHDNTEHAADNCMKLEFFFNSVANILFIYK